MTIDEAIEKSAEILADEWWKEKNEKFGKYYAKEITRAYAKKLLELSGGRRNDNRSND